jgi:hypothetical protein
MNLGIENYLNWGHRSHELPKWYRKYADDTILFMEYDLEKAQNLKLILSAFEQLSELKINFHKSELFCFGEALNEVSAYANLFGCGQGQFPIRYLGIPIHYRSSLSPNGNKLRRGFKSGFPVGKVN